jgi:4-hydroxy-tetrahydrodipicolinate synthase
MARLHGILAATVTPFTSEDRIDEGSMRCLVRELIKSGVHGLVPTGGTGEFSTLTLDERKEVTELVSEAAEGHVPVVPHVGTVATVLLASKWEKRRLKLCEGFVLPGLTERR